MSPLNGARSTVWTITAIAVAIVVVTAFLWDLVFHDWRSWAIAVSLVLGIAGANLALKQGQPARTMVCVGSLAIVTLLLIYDVVDAIIDPFMEADWPVAIVAVLLGFGLERLFAPDISERLARMGWDLTGYRVRDTVPIAALANIPAAAAVSFGNLSTRYTGRNAENYERDRSGKKWVAEDRAVEQLLTLVGKGSSILDAPVGTGRFFPYFNDRKFKTHGVDISADMLAQARANAERIGARVRLIESDILSLPYDDESFDVVTCIRFLNLIDLEAVGLVLHELTRVSGDKMMIGVRYFTPFSDLRARPADLVRLAMRLTAIPRFLARRRGLVFHEKQSLTELLDGLGVEVRERSFVERRWDGTDYVILLLRKRTSN
jgi:ubiquinone/menaquinone biosynthesis C-methylase UbiE